MSRGFGFLPKPACHCLGPPGVPRRGLHGKDSTVLKGAIDKRALTKISDGGVLMLIISYKLLKYHTPGAAGVYPRICQISIPAASGAFGKGLTSVSPGDFGRNPPPGVCLSVPVGLAGSPSVRAVCPSRSVGPVPSPQSAQRRYGRRCLFRILSPPPRFPPLAVGGGSSPRVGRGSVGLSPWLAAFGSCWLRPFRPVLPIPRPGRALFPAPSMPPRGCGSGPVPVPGPCWRKWKMAEGFPPPSVCPALSPSDSVIYIPVLDHAVGVVVRDDDMIENEDPDAVEQLLELNR